MKTFEVTSGHVNLSDPCYSVGTWCGKYNVPAKNGEWVVNVERSDQGVWGNRVAGFTAYHKDHYGINLLPIDQDFGVDSGTFGIFDSDNYKGDTDDDERKWYFAVCEHTFGGAQAGVIDDGSGFVSSSGFGDGSYAGEVAFVNDELVGFKIVFITEQDDENEDDF